MHVLRLTNKEYYNTVQLLCIVADVKFEDFEIANLNGKNNFTINNKIQFKLTIVVITFRIHIDLPK